MHCAFIYLEGNTTEGKGSRMQNIQEHVTIVHALIGLVFTIICDHDDDVRFFLLMVMVTAVC